VFVHTQLKPTYELDPDTQAVHIPDILKKDAAHEHVFETNA
jgi:hypothetical protein